MNRPLELMLNYLRGRFCSRSINENLIKDPDVVKKMICDLLNSNKPCMIARYGAFEGAVVLNYTGIINSDRSYYKYIKGQCEAWWWNKHLLNCLCINAGFFPLKDEYIQRYCELMLEDSSQIDIVGCFDNNDNAERLRTYHHNCKYVRLACLEPDYYSKDSSKEWTSCLKGRRVLVVHPFAETIKSQYAKRTKLFIDSDFLPEFELLTIKAIQSIGGVNSKYATWFEALRAMQNEMDMLDYDIAILGCGAYGFNLAAHAKRTGHKAIHLGGSTQILFGIRGKRWENMKEFKRLMNSYWVRPSDIDKPQSALRVEGGCYW